MRAGNRPSAGRRRSWHTDCVSRRPSLRRQAFALRSPRGDAELFVFAVWSKAESAGTNRYLRGSRPLGSPLSGHRGSSFALPELAQSDASYLRDRYRVRGASRRHDAVNETGRTFPAGGRERAGSGVYRVGAVLRKMPTGSGRSQAACPRNDCAARYRPKAHGRATGQKAHQTEAGDRDAQTAARRRKMPVRANATPTGTTR